VGIHVANEVGRDSGIAHGVAHHAESAFVFWRGLGDVIRVARHTVARNFRDDGRAALLRVLEFFEYQNTRAFADHKAVARLIPGTAGFFRLVVARGKRAHGGESTDAHRSDRSFRAARDHHVRVIVLNDAERIANRVRAGGASGRRSLVWPLGAVAHGDLAGSQIDDCRRNEKGRDLPRAAFDQVGMFALDDVESTDARADVHAHAFVVLRCDFQAGLFQRFVGGRDGEVDEPRHLLDFFFLDVIERVEVLDVGGDLAGEIGDVEAGNPPNAALPGQQRFPHLLGGVAHATDQAEARDYDPASQFGWPPFLRLSM